MVDTNYTEAVQALASGINARNGSLSNDRKIQISRSLMQQENIESLDEWNEIELNLSDSAIQKLREYSAELHEAYDAEIGKEIHLSIENARKLSELRSELKKEIDNAMNEDQELEKIAERLQDPDLGKIAGKEEHEINELGRKLEKLDKKGQEVEKLEQKLLDTTNKLGIGHGEIHHALEKRSKAIGQLIKKGVSGTGSSGGAGSGSDTGKEWKPLLDNPQAHITPKNSVGIKQKELNQYKNGNNFSRSPDQQFNNYRLPEQGFKLHITSGPDEGYEIVKELIPILQANGIRHKIMRSKDWMEDRLKSHGDTQALKLMTIYPKTDPSGPNKQIFTPGDKNQNKKAFFLNEPHTRDVLNLLLNQPDPNLMQGGPKLEGNRKFLGAKFNAEEFRVKNTRIHLTYSIVSSMTRGVAVNNNSLDMEHWVRKTDSNGDFIDNSDPNLPFPEYEPSDNFRKTGKGYYLGHLNSKGISKQKSEDVKQALARKDQKADEAILGLDAKISGAHYLPPPEGIKRIQQIISNL